MRLKQKKILQTFNSLVGLTLDEACWVGGQCTGTPNSGVCMADRGKDGKLICQCSPGFIKHNDSCFQGNLCYFSKQLFSIIYIFIIPLLLSYSC